MKSRAARLLQQSVSTTRQNYARSSSAIHRKESIFSEIHQAVSGADIFATIESWQRSKCIIDVSVYHRAMDKCKSLRDYQAIPAIMDLLSQSNLPLDAESLNSFIRTMNHSNSADECVRYFDSMVSDNGITPNMETFAGLFKSFESPRTIGKLEKYWNLMRDRFHLDPPPSLYAQVIRQYSNADHREKAVQIFNEYLQRLQRRELAVHPPIFSAYLNIFSSCGDLEGIHSALDILKEHGIDCNHRVIITIIVSGHYNAREHRKCIELIDEWIQNGNVPDSNLLRFKCAALSRILQDESTFPQKQKIYRRLQDVIHRDLKDYGLDITPKIASIYLIAAISLYHNVNPMEMVKLYHDLERRQFLKQYISSEFGTFSASKEINVHFADILEAQFVIRYLFGYRLEEVMDNGDDEVIWILVGKGKHSKGMGRNQGKMRQFVIKELSNWNPPLECKPHPFNHGLLSVDKRQLTPYLKRDRMSGMNAVQRMLLNPSTRWNVVDPRWMDIVERTIAESDCAQSIVSAVKDHENAIEYPRFYVKAMRKCAALRDIGAVQHVMQLLMNSEHDLTVEHFNVFFEIMVDFGVAEVNRDYLESMVHRLGIEPDLKTYSVITKSVRTMSGNMTEWEKQGMLRLLEAHFSDVRCDQGVHDQKSQRSMVVDDERIGMCADGGDDDDHLENVFECIRPRKGYNLHSVLVADMMRGYLLNGDYQQCIDIFDFCVREDIDRVADERMLHLKCVALLCRSGELTEDVLQH